MVANANIRQILIIAIRPNIHSDSLMQKKNDDKMKFFCSDCLTSFNR